MPEGAIGARRFAGSDFGAERVRSAKGASRVSVCIPAHDEAETVGQVVAQVVELADAGVVDEVVVVADGCGDDTASRALSAGARVVETPEGRPGRPGGKGQAMAVGLRATSGDVVVFLDADVVGFRGSFVTGLLGPLLEHPSLVLVKGCYSRPLHGVPGEGGRVTELVARPLLARLFPSLAWLSQPLAGEVALRRSALLGVELGTGYGVEVAMLVDVARRHGPAAIAESDLGTREHRNRPLRALAAQADEVLAVLFGKAGIPLPDPGEPSALDHDAPEHGRAGRGSWPGPAQAARR